MPASRKRLTGVVATLAVVASGLLLLPSAPAQASVAAKISDFPYTQNWSGLSATSTWADFPGVEGFTTGTSIAAANLPNTTDVGTLTAEGTLSSALSLQSTTAAPNTVSTGGILGFHAIGNKTVALSATGSITTPLLVFHLDTTGKKDVGFAYDIQDLDSSGDDQPTRVALQYRLGSSGAYTNVPTAYVTDATVASNPTVTSTPVSVTLPAAVNNQPDVYVRVITLDNATGSNEHIGIDNISITAEDQTEVTPLVAADPGDKTGRQGRAIGGFTLNASGGTPPYRWSATGLPNGVTVSPSGAVSGTPTESGEFEVTATVTDDEDETAITEFTMTIAEPIPTATHVVVSEVWGDGGFTNAPFKNSFVELYNPTDDAISLAGSALAYLPSSNNGTIGTTQRVNLTGSIPAKGYYLISGYSSGTAGEALPTPDATTTINWHYQNGTIALLDTQSAFSIPGGNLAGVEHITDAVGYGGNTAYVPVAYEGAPTGTNTGLSVSAVRSPVEADSDNNSVDFATDSPTPTNSAGVSGGGSTVCDPAFPSTATIAQIQGTASAAAGNNCTVTTEGVVTGIYKDVDWAGASSGYDGMYIQTGGTGGTTDSTPGASDAIFVYGANATPAGVAIGDSVQVTGKVTEFARLTEITPASGGVVELGSPLPAVTPFETAYPTTDAAREALEGMLLAPTGDFTVTNAYITNGTGEIGLASGTTPLKQPSEFADATNDAAMQAIRDENAGRAVTLDDGTAINYLQNQTTKSKPVPYLTAADGSANPAPPRVGAAVDLQAPVIFEFRDGVWKFQPTSPVFLNGADVATFEDTRASDLHPQDVGGDLTISTFNVLNYFNTTGEAYEAAGPLQNPPLDTDCTFYTDRGDPGPPQVNGQRISNNTCGVVTDGVNAGNGPRGAATTVSLARQEAKLANTIEALDADIIALEEIENSIKLPGETNRDDALANLVQILNSNAGETKWAYVKSPGEALTSANIAEQDLIRSAFIYQVATVQTVGKSDILFGTTQFANAREPLAQVFKAKGAPDADGFAVIANHFKSKGDNQSPAPPAVGDNANHAEVGAFNGDRKRQSARLLQFADAFAESRDIEPVFLAGDFNSYTMEEPITALEDGGYELIESDQEGEESYSYNGLSGSLDHVLGNAAAMGMVTGADIWEINANEAASFMYSRYNYNVTNFWQPELPFGTSDHNPEIIGVDVPDFESVEYREIQVLGTNDFHGRLLPDAGNAAGAAPFATAVKQLKEEVPDSIFVAAGDLVGASTFESFIQDDEPTIDALNAMGLEVSAAGNHEFDRGYEDFVGRIQDLAQWEYIAANVNEPAGRDDLAETFTKTFGTGDDAIQVGFVGAVTEDLPALVNPAGIEGVTVSDIVDSTNAAAEDLKEAGADLVVLLVHEGSSSTECSNASFTDPATTWGNIVQNTSSDVDAIISGHTHLAYNCRFPVADWVTEGRAVTRRPVVSAGQYGTNLNQLVFKLDEETGDLAAISQDVVAVAGVGYAPDPEVQVIVDRAVDYAEDAGAEVLGTMDGPFKRAQYQGTSGATENRGGESTLGNQVAEVQRWATDSDIAFMNPGGLRADMLGTPNAALRDLTYRDAADVQPFANTLVNMQLTGAQIETVLEQQWQRNDRGGVPSRPFLRLGVSEGFTYTYVETPETVSVPNAAPVNTFQGEITGMWLDGEPIDPAATYSVTVNSFLSTGGDNFWELANGTDRVDTGKVDLEAMVDYMEQYGDGQDPLAVDYSQRAVQVTFPGDAPEEYGVGDTISLDVASWAMTADGDVTDSQILLKLGDTTIGTSGPVDNARANAPYDTAGKAHVEGTVPAGIDSGDTTLMLVGNNTGTEIPVEVTLEDGIENIQILATNDFHGRLARNPSGAEAGAAVLSGAVKELREENPETVFAAAGDLIGASTFESFIQDDKPTIDALNEAGLDVSAVGNHEFDQGYDDLVNRVMAEYDAEDNPRGGAEWAYIGANVRMKTDHSPALEPSWIKDFGDVQVGFIGAVTEDLPSLVSPSGIEDIEVTDIVTEANAEAEDLKTEGADIVVLLVHEGAATTALSAATDDSAFGQIVNGVNADIDAIVSGHTHLAYNHAITVPEWVSEDRPVTERPVVSAGQYGYNLNQLQFAYDTNSGEVVGLQQDIIALQSCTNCPTSGTQVWSPNFDADPAVTTIVNQANAVAETLGAQVLGSIGGPFNRSKLSNGNENRGGESTLGNLVAEVQRWATDTPETGSAEIAFMNPGGLRADMTGTGTGAFPRDLTYKQAAVVQPFANTLVNMDLTGADIKLALEQQWQRDAGGAIPSRPFLRLGASEGFTYTFDASKAEGSRITGMWLDGEPIDLDETYSVTVNSFLASGGDNFRAFNNGTNKRDTGKVDLEAMVDYLAEFAPSADPLPVDSSQRAVGVTFPNDAPETYEPGGSVKFALSSLDMAGTGNTQDAQVQILVDGEQIGTAPVDHTNGTEVFDNYGTANVDVTLPGDLPDGPVTLVIRGATTGTEVPVTVDVLDVVREIQVLATNDFHGRLTRNPSGAEAGAAVLAGAVKQLREENESTVFAAAGDLIGASTFESFIQNDKPTIDALNEAGLEVSAVGNHEFDQGYDDLVDRVMAEYDAEDNPEGGAEWQYIGANVRMKTDHSPALDPSWIKEFGDVQVGFVGAVTEDLPSLVNPDGISQLEITDIVDSVNAEAANLKEDGADIIVMLVHEGAPSTACNTMNTGGGAFASIVNGVSADVDAIVSGHTHLAYNCKFPVAAWAGRAVTERPVVSAGQYGYNLNQLEFSYDTAADELLSIDQEILALQHCTTCSGSQVWVPNYDADPATTQIVQDAVDAAAPLGAQVLGKLGGPFTRAKFAGGGENRGGESTLGNLVAEVQRYETPAATVGEAQIAFMNPGGLRTDMTGTGTGAFPRDLTYRQAANVQPFANTLVNMDLTGAQIETVLEQQWQRAANGSVPSRAFLKLGISDGFTYTYRQVDDPDHPGQKLGEVTGMWLDGEAIEPATTYSVTVNSFLASGGDNFRELANGADKQDTGVTDLQAMVDYLDEFGTGAGVPVDYRQRAVNVTFPGGAPASYQPGSHVVFDLASLSMTDPGDLRDTQVEVRLGGDLLGTFPVTTTVSSSADNSANSNDEAGVASVDVVVPVGTARGAQTLTVTGVQTGTQIPVLVQVAATPPPSTTPTSTTATAAPMTWGTDGTVNVTVMPSTATGAVTVSNGGTQVGSGTVTSGSGTVTIDGKALEPGTHTLTVRYAGSATHDPSQGTVTITVEKAATTLSASAPSVEAGAEATVSVTATPGTAAGPVTVSEGGTTLGSGTLADGAASISLGTALAPGSHTLTVQYAGDEHHAEATTTTTLEVSKAVSTTSVSVDPDTVQVGDRARVAITVASPVGTPTGTVVVFVDGRREGADSLVDGRGSVRIGPLREAGRHSIEVEYRGDDRTERSSATASIKVEKAPVSISVSHTPRKVKVNKTSITLKVEVSADGFTPHGDVLIRVPGQRNQEARVNDNGVVRFDLVPFDNVGVKTITVVYQGNGRAERATEEHTFRVVRR